MQFQNTEFWELSPARNSGPKFQVTTDGQRVTRDYLVQGRPSIIRQAIIDFLGYSSVKRANGTNYISRELPHTIKEYARSEDTRQYLFASSVNVIESYTIQANAEAVEGGTLPNYKFAKLTVTYSAFRYRIKTDAEIMSSGVPDEGGLGRYFFKFSRPFTRVITLPRRLMRWVEQVGGEGTPPVLEGIPINEPGLDLTYTHIGRPDFPTNRLIAGIGTVNSTTFDGFPAGTLLCESPEITIGVQSTGDSMYDFAFKFKFLPRRARAAPNAGTARGWNWHPRWLSGSSTWDYRRLTSDGTGTGTPPFESSDFHDLFRPDA